MERRGKKKYNGKEKNEKEITKEDRKQKAGMVEEEIKLGRTGK